MVDAGEMDIVLKARWSGMKESLLSGDSEKALTYFNEESKAKYAQIFELLQDKLPELAANMQDITLLYVRESNAKYRIRRDQVINGEQHIITYYIYFTKDPDGLWKIVSF